MRKFLLIVFVALQPWGAVAAEEAHNATQEVVTMSNFKKITPVLLADDVEACIRFWNQLGLTTSITVPFDGGMGFAALAGGDVEVMYQSNAMSRAQDPGAIEGVGRGIVYLDVRSLDEIVAKLGDAQVVVAVRETEHGTREIHVRDPAGNLIGFSEAIR